MGKDVVVLTDQGFVVEAWIDEDQRWSWLMSWILSGSRFLEAGQEVGRLRTTVQDLVQMGI